MAKDPAFLFYPGDWLGGTMTFSRHHKGAYMDLLMGQFNNGHMGLHMVEAILGQKDYSELWEKILKPKFKADSDGNFYNQKLEDEILKRKKYTKSRQDNLIKNKPHMDAHMVSHMAPHMENENEIITDPSIRDQPTSKGSETTKLKIVIPGLGDFEIVAQATNEGWQAKELAEFLSNSEKEFTAIACTKREMNNLSSFQLVLQEFVNIIQTSGEYQNSAGIRKYFSNWLHRKNGTLEDFISKLITNPKKQQSKIDPKVKGKQFSDDFTEVTLSDGTIQKLDNEQFIQAKHGLINPSSIVKGSYNASK